MRGRRETIEFRDRKGEVIYFWGRFLVPRASIDPRCSSLLVLKSSLNFRSGISERFLGKIKFDGEPGLYHVSVVYLLLEILKGADRLP